MGQAAPLPYDVLVVEDTSYIAEFELRVLRRIGINARHAEFARAAIAMFNEHRPDLIILDLNLPDVGGWQLLEYARQKMRHMPPVIVTSAEDDRANRLNGKLYGVSKYLVKPVTLQQLTDAVREVLKLEDART